MAIIKENYLIPLNRMLFISKKDGLKLEDIIVETEGDYRLFEKDDNIVIKNDDCCRSIKVTVKTKE
ncbi:MAG TPA: hypothetical protein P5309_08420 [Syntrophomonadaceae bacterium]|jgi:hypothetical protein|nr:hypothetical protein [Syntrophomonadaceae bacterium]